MQKISNNSPSFGSIQVGLSKMNSAQRRISDRLFDSLKYSEKYSKLTFEKRAGSELDIYMLPRKGKGIEIRFMDPYSGDFVRKDNKIIKEKLCTALSDEIEAISDKIVEIYEKIVKGKIARPKENVDKVVNCETEMCRINPDKAVDFTESIDSYKALGYTQREAEEQAFEEYKSLYHVDNKDADF